MEELLCLSPVDGRYQEATKELEPYFSEYALIKYRVVVEVKWLLKLLPMLTDFKEASLLEDILSSFDLNEAKMVKEIEKTTKHDVKAVEYYLRNKFMAMNLDKYCSYIHFGCTSEDINNLAYNMMIDEAIQNVYLPNMSSLIDLVKAKAYELRDVPMMSHTHGQPATPTTVGKELAVFVYRYQAIVNLLKSIKLRGKFSSASGNFNAHVIAYPEIDWLKVNQEFVESLNQEFNPLTTQIESHDIVCVIFNYIKSINNITNDFNSDMWLYISMNYFKQKVIKGEVGSSVMPHKVNPINHENSMANIRISNGILTTLSDNLPISRMQRDLSDSSMQRNIGVAFGHSLISIKQTMIGFNKMIVNEEAIMNDLNNNCALLAEPIQTILRKNGYVDAYEQLKELTRGKTISIEAINTFVANLKINEDDKKRLLQLTPQSYLGLASKLVDFIK